MTAEIVFSQERLEYLADLFGKYIDDDGFLRESEDDELVRDEYDDDPIKASDLGIVSHNSEHFVRDDVSNLLQHAKQEDDE